MAKPILIVRTVLSAPDKEAKDDLVTRIESYYIEKTMNEYHVVVVGVKEQYGISYPQIEVYGIPETRQIDASDFGDIKVKVTGRDIPFSRT